MTKLVAGGALLSWLLAASMAYAAGDAGEHGASPGLFTGDVGNIVWTLITFIAVIVVLGRFAWGPILRGLQSREDFIRTSLADADAANRKAKELLEQYTAKLDEARADATAIVEEGRRDAEVVKRTIEEEGRKQSDAMIARAKREIDIARDAAVRDLYDLGGKLATEVAGRIIRKELNPADHEQLIKESIAELGQAQVSKN